MVGLEGDNLIFVLSQPRSGSTLLQRVLAGHPNVHTSAEPWLMLHPLFGMEREGIEAVYGAKWSAEAMREFLDNYADGDNTYERAVRAMANQIYGEALRLSGKTIFLDKTPRYFFIAPKIHKIFPKAKYVFLYRNPMSVLSSELRTYASEKLNTLSLFNADLLSAPTMLLDAERQLAESAVRVNYETFVQDPEAETQRLCEFLGIDYNPGMVDYEHTPAPKGKMNDPIGIHKHKRPSATSVERWKELANEPQTAHLAQRYLEELGPETLCAMGYDYDKVASELGTRVPVSRKIWSWEMAINPQETWSTAQHIHALRKSAIDDRGFFMGYLRTLRRSLQRVSIGLDFKK